ncbi:unnamed protein product [Alternaria burnsii]|nr:unnamed protein product [Alternaria burnsii]
MAGSWESQFQRYLNERSHSNERQWGYYVLFKYHLTKSGVETTGFASRPNNCHIEENSPSFDSAEAI